MKIHCGAFLFALVAAGCGGGGNTDNGQIAGDYRFSSISIKGQSTNCPGSVTVDEEKFECGYDTIRFDAGGTFSMNRNSSSSLGSFSYASGNLSFATGGTSRSASVETQDAGDVLIIRFYFGDNEIWTLRRS